ncbi:uncharacterized protein LOC120336862 [Styela clava]|uniref:uncharacterized protein LOC120336862 n=1 Tax=Styela clava TaxID=7725 RepID=UPI001939EE7A|nr:uncharacterized protein LOC120336862 [Styela clava]
MAHEKVTGTIDRATMVDTVIASSHTTFYNRAGTEYHVSVPEVGSTAERQVSAGTLDITDTAMGTVVIGSHDTVIDNSGTKTTIKVSGSDASSAGSQQHPESDRQVNHSSSQSGIDTSGSVVLNSVVGSDDTNIKMDGAVIHIKRKKKNKSHASRQIKDGEINLANSAAVSMVAYSERTKVNIVGSEINIE